jgi:hypothetical protein
MQERAASLGGSLAVQSEPGKGTCVRLRVPVPGALSLLSEAKDLESGGERSEPG